MLIENVGIGVLFLLAFASGANDVGKSVAIIVETNGGRSLRRALVFGGLFSALGSVTAVLIAKQLLSTFTSTLLTPTPADTFIQAALSGTLVWILGATLLRLPVSLTHAIVGSILFLGVYLFGLHSLAWTSIFIRVFLPLAAGPFAVPTRLPRTQTQTRTSNAELGDGQEIRHAARSRTLVQRRCHHLR